MRATLNDELFRGLGVYQDVIQGGQTVRGGSRDCQRRYELLAPRLPESGAVLDIGSNFGWFGWKICEDRPECIVASVEADLQSAAVQRAVLQSLPHARICFLLERAGERMMRRFADAGQRFEAALCLSVLHWIPDHERMLRSLGQIAKRIFIEHPDPEEPGAGVPRIRREIGRMGDYLQCVFPDRDLEFLGHTPSNRAAGYSRELWLVSDRTPVAAPSIGLAVPPLLASSVSWPPRSWWEGELARFPREESPAAQDIVSPRVEFTPRGLTCAGPWTAGTLDQLRRSLQRIPEAQLLHARTRYFRHTRRLAGRVWRAGRSLVGIEP